MLYIGHWPCHLVAMFLMDQICLSYFGRSFSVHFFQITCILNSDLVPQKTYKVLVIAISHTHWWPYFRQFRFLLAIFVEGRLMAIAAELISILTWVSGVDKSFLHRYIKETGHPPSRHVS